MEDLPKRRLQLTTRLAELRSRIGRIDGELAGHQEKDWEDLAAEREGDEVLEGMGMAGVQEARQIEAALQRLDAGEYGFCTTCGAAIAPGRLDLLPATPFCREHAG